MLWLIKSKRVSVKKIKNKINLRGKVKNQELLGVEVFKMKRLKDRVTSLLTLKALLKASKTKVTSHLL
jgi:hypothetical protein